MTFEFKKIGCIASNKITEFILKNERAYNLRYINDNEPIVFDEKSKIYECYLNEVLVAFIILEVWDYGDGYEIIFGTLTDDTNVHFTEILRQFLQNEYKEDLKKQLSEAKAKRAATENENAVVDKLIETSTMDIPEPMVEAQVEGLVADYGRRMESQGITLDQYLQITGMTKADLNNQFKPQALKQIKTRLVLEEVAKAEKITVSEAEIDEELQKIADSYKMDLEKIKGFFGENERKQMTDDLAVQKAIDFLVENAKLV